MNVYSKPTNLENQFWVVQMVFAPNVHPSPPNTYTHTHTHTHTLRHTKTHTHTHTNTQTYEHANIPYITYIHPPQPPPPTKIKNENTLVRSVFAPFQAGFFSISGQFGKYLIIFQKSHYRRSRDEK